MLRISLLAAMIASPAYAEENTRCTGYALAAATIMSARQAGAPQVEILSQAIPYAADQTVAESINSIIGKAFEWPMLTGATDKLDVIHDFSTAVLAVCLSASA